MRYELMDYLTIYAEHWGELSTEFLRHLSMTSLAVLLALLIGVPLGIFITRNKRISGVVVGFANIMQSIPSMALLGLGIPLFGIGENLAVFMVFVYAFLPILKNTYTGISSISPTSMEVARGIGLTRMQQLTRVELPMAIPYIMSGIRIAAVSAVGTMTIAAFAGAKGLGWFIVLGMNSSNPPMILMGAVASSLMALGLDFLLGRVERAVTSEGLLPPAEIKNLSAAVRKRRKLVAVGLCAALLAASALSMAATHAPAGGAGKKTITVGSKNFTEAIILANIYSELIRENTDYAVDEKFNLNGTSVCFTALNSGDIDMFLEYTGTALLNVLHQPMDTDKERVYQTVHDTMADEYGIAVSAPLGFNNTYVMSVRPDTAKQYGLATLSDLIAHAGELRMGCTVEFTQREDGLPLLESAYGANFKTLTGLDSTLRYNALEANEIDVIDAFSTDGLLLKMGLVKLTDDLSFFPPYYAVNFVKQSTLDADPALAAVLGKLDGAIDEEAMAAMNAKVDVDGADAKQVAHDFLVEKNLI